MGPILIRKRTFQAGFVGRWNRNSDGVVSKIVVTKLKRTVWVFFCSLALALQSLPAIALNCSVSPSNPSATVVCHCCGHTGNRSCCSHEHGRPSKQGQKGSNHSEGCALGCRSVEHSPLVPGIVSPLSHPVADVPSYQPTVPSIGRSSEANFLGSDSGPPQHGIIAPDLGRAPPVL